MPQLLLFAAAVAAFAISAVAGGGAGLILLPVLGFVVPLVQVPAALSLGTAASSLSRAVVFRRDVRWDVVRWFVPAALPAAALGVWLLTRIEPLWFEMALGGYLSLNLVAAVRRRTPRPGSPLARPVLAAVGAGAGFLSGFTGAVGVVFNGVYLRCGMTKEEIVATRGANELLLHLLKIALYVRLGLVGREAVAAGAIVAAAALLASLLARPLVGTLGDAVFRYVNRGAMAVAGIAMLITSGSTLGARYGVALRGHLDARGMEAGLTMRGTSISLEWPRGGTPQFERTVAMASVPHDVRESAEDMSREAGGTPARFETVRDIHGLSYEIHVGGRTRHLVVTD